MPSAAPDASGSGRRIIRNEVTSPRSAARIGTSERDLKRERSSVRVDPDDLGLDRLGLADEELLELGVAHHLGVVLEPVGDLLLLGRGQHRAVFGHVGEGERERRQHDGAGERQAEREPERAGRPSSRPAASLTRSSEIGDSV